MSDRDPEVVAVAREWLQIAERDLAAARVLLGAGGLTRAVCFHAQQAVEKYLKTLLVVNGTPFGKTHDMGELLRLLPQAQRPSLTPEAASRLTRSAVADRYPEAPEPSDEEAGWLLDHATQVREFVRSVLPPDVEAP
jgi:HEPN domain-containing protein